MANNNNMLQLCRLCLVKDDVNIPIFEEQGDIRQIFLKISSCLPVKVSREDRLPKKICDGCSYKLDMLYEFWNTSANAEKQLLSWLGEAGVSSKMADGAISAVAQQMRPAEVKEETLEPDHLHNVDEDDKDYLFEQQRVVEAAAAAGPSATVTSNDEEEPPPKRARRTAAVKAAIAMDQDSDDDDDSGEPLTKIEDESDDSEGEDHVPAFVDVPSTSADDQPGPSGVGKEGVEAPQSEKTIEKALLKEYKMRNCSIIIKRQKLQPTIKRVVVPKELEKSKRKYTCYTCWQKFDFKHEVNRHKVMHEEEEKAKTQALMKAESMKSKESPKKPETPEAPPSKHKKLKELGKKSEKVKESLKKAKKFKESQKQPENPKEPIAAASSEPTTPSSSEPIAPATSEPIDSVSSDGPLYHCDKCDVSFWTIDQVKKHPKNNCRFNCDVCSRTYNTVHGFTVHILQHKINATKPRSSSRYECSDCPSTFTDIIQLRSHSLIAHTIVARKEPAMREEEDFTCEQCFDVFRSKKELDDHMQFHEELQTSEEVDTTDLGLQISDGVDATDLKLPKSEEVDKAEFKVSQATILEVMGENNGDAEENTITQSDLDSLSTSIILPKEEALGEELEEEIPGDNDVIESHTCRALKPTKTIPRTHFNCVVCQRIYMDEPEFEQHLMDDKCSQIKACSICDLKFEDNYVYYKHVRQNHETVIICKYCFEVLPDSSTNDKHKLEHFKSFKNLCRICIRIFETYDEFCAHLKDHLSL